MPRTSERQRQPILQYTLTVVPGSAGSLALSANGMVNVNGNLYPNVNNPSTSVVNSLPMGTTNAYYSQSFRAFGGSGGYSLQRVGGLRGWPQLSRRRPPG